MKSATAKQKTNENKYRDSRWDLAVGSLCLVIGVFGLRLAGKINSFDELTSPTGSSIGEVRWLNGGVRYRAKSSILWHDLSNDTRSVGNGDMIFTGDDGSADLTLDGNSSARVMSNSLVVVRSTAKAEQQQASGLAGLFNIGVEQTKTVQVEKGGVRIDLKEGADGVEVVANGTTFLAKAKSSRASVDISIDPNDPNAGLKIQSDNDVELTVKGKAGAEAKKFDLSAGQAAIVPKGKQLTVEEPAYRPLLPTANTKLVVAADTLKDELPAASIKFTWRPVKTTAPRTAARLELEGRERVSLRITDDISENEIPLTTGNYRWRLASESMKQGERWTTAWTSFSVTALGAPVAIAPANGFSTFVQEGEEQNINFEWQALKPDARAEIEVVDKDGVQRIIAANEGETQVEASFQPGQYRWRVRSVSEKLPASGWSTWRELGLPLDIYSNVDHLNASKKVEVLKSKRLDKLPIRVKWEPLPGVENYSVSVLDSDGKVIISRNVKGSFTDFKLNSLENKPTFIVKGVTPNGRTIASEETPVIPDLPSPGTRFPASGALLPRKRYTYLTWTKTALTSEYTVQIAHDSAFKSVVVDEQRADNFIRFFTGAPGEYFWRVRAKAGDLESRWSPARRFEVQ